MPIEERLYDIGRFSFNLDKAPRDIWNRLNYFQWVIFTHTWIDPDLIGPPAWGFGLGALSAGILRGAYYSGVIRRLNDGQQLVEGCSLLALLGDEDGRSPRRTLSNTGNQTEEVEVWWNTYLEQHAAKVGISWDADWTTPTTGITFNYKRPMSIRGVMDHLVRDVLDDDWVVTALGRVHAGSDSYRETPTSIILPSGFSDDPTYYSPNTIELDIERDTEQFATGWGVEGDTATNFTFSRPRSLKLPFKASDYAWVADPSPGPAANGLFVAAWIEAADYTPAATQAICSKWNSTSNQRSWQIRLNTTGNIVALWSTNGTNSNSVTSTFSLDVKIASGDPVWIGVLYLGTSNVIKIMWSADGMFWRDEDSLGAGGAFSLFNSSAQVQMGTENGASPAVAPFNGYFRELRLHNIDTVGTPHYPDPGHPEDKPYCLVQFHDEVTWKVGATTGKEMVTGATVTLVTSTPPVAEIIDTRSPATPVFNNLVGGDMEFLGFTDGVDDAIGANSAQAAAALARDARGINEAFEITTGSYDLVGNMDVGDNVYIYDPASGIANLETPINYGESTIYPQTKRLMGREAPIRGGVYVLVWNPVLWTHEILDLTPYIVTEEDDITLSIGAVGQVDIE